MHIPGLTIALAKEFEGLHRVVTRRPVITVVPYLCPANFWTIGYGHLCAKDHPPIIEDQAEAYLALDLQTALLATLRYCPCLASEPEHRLAPIVDFTFNLGAGRLQTSTLRRRINEQDWNEAGNELLRWVNGGGRVLPGLVRRREAERLMLLGDFQAWQEAAA
jgi:lysozyme